MDPPADREYRRLLGAVLEAGVVKPTRQGGYTRSLLAQQVRFPMRAPPGTGAFPLLTSKKMAWRTLVTELQWFVRGDTDVKWLQDRGVKIWDADAARAGGTLGPIYGRQWRNWSGRHDQLARVVRAIRANPYGRRHIVSAWNVDELDQMALPPCHCLFQFVAQPAGEDHEGFELSLALTMRSTDIGLGLPFNIASYALLLHVVARETGAARVGELVVTCNDAHVYGEHEEALRAHIQEPRAAPTPQLRLPPEINSLEAVAGADPNTCKDWVECSPGPALRLPLIA